MKKDGLSGKILSDVVANKNHKPNNLKVIKSDRGQIIYDQPYNFEAATLMRVLKEIIEKNGINYTLLKLTK
jgi:hypothetical protein